MSEGSIIVVKKGHVVTTFPKSELMKVEPTHDGIIFEFTGGLHLYFSEPYMPTATKHKISHDVNKFKGKITVDLLNPNVPVTIEMK